MPFYVDDFLGSTLVRTLENEGCALYLKLLFACWQDGSLPTDERTLRTLTGASSSAWKRNWPQIQTRFKVADDGRYHNDRVDEELAKLDAKSQQARDAAAVRWQCERNASASFSHRGNDAERMRERCHPDPEPDPVVVPDGTTASNGSEHDSDGEPLARHLADALRESGVDPKATVTATSARGFGQLYRRLRRDGVSADEADRRIRAAVSGVFADPTPDAGGFAWADVMRSGKAWASKTRSGDRFKFDLIEQHLARKAAPKPRRETLADRNRAVIEAAKAEHAARERRNGNV